MSTILVLEAKADLTSRVENTQKNPGKKWVDPGNKYPKKCERKYPNQTRVDLLAKKPE